MLGWLVTCCEWISLDVAFRLNGSLCSLCSLCCRADRHDCWLVCSDPGSRFRSTGVHAGSTMETRKHNRIVGHTGLLLFRFRKGDIVIVVGFSTSRWQEKCRSRKGVVKRNKQSRVATKGKTQPAHSNKKKPVDQPGDVLCTRSH